MQQTTLLIITRGVLLENFQAEDDQLPVEVIDAVQAEAALQAPTSISTAGGEF